MRVGVVGAGSWGTALAHLLATKGNPVSLWHRDPAVVQAINATHKNPKYLKDVKLPDSLTATLVLRKRSTSRRWWSPSCRRMPFAK